MIRAHRELILERSLDSNRGGAGWNPWGGGAYGLHEGGQAGLDIRFGDSSVQMLRKSFEVRDPDSRRGDMHTLYDVVGMVFVLPAARARQHMFRLFPPYEVFSNGESRAQPFWNPQPVLYSRSSQGQGCAGPIQVAKDVLDMEASCPENFRRGAVIKSLSPLGGPAG